MIVKRDSKKFEPVTITIESQAELNILYAALSNSNKNLQELWEDMGYETNLSLELDNDMFMQINSLY